MKRLLVKGEESVAESIVVSPHIIRIRIITIIFTITASVNYKALLTRATPLPH